MIDALIDGASTVVVLHSPHVADPALRTMLRELPCRVKAYPLDRTMPDAVRATAPSVVVVDHSTSDFNVVRVVRELAQMTTACVVVLAGTQAPGDDQWLVERLHDGAHLILPAATSKDVLVAQLRAVLRDAPHAPLGPERLIVGDVTIDVGAHRLLIDGSTVSCSPVLFSLLVALAGSPNRVLPRETLLGRVWGVSPTAANLRRVRIAASQLRRLLGAGPRRPRIETVARVGYCLAID